MPSLFRLTTPGRRRLEGSERMDRRDLFKAAGLISAGAIAPSLLAACQSAGGGTGFELVAVSGAQTVGGVKHRIVVSGQGKFTTSSVEGSGGFFHFNDAPDQPPKPLLESGTWQAKKFVSFTEKQVYEGLLRLGVLEIEIDMMPKGKPAITGAKMRIACNVGFAGITTGQPEGFFLTIPGVDYGTFEPLTPGAGLTAIFPM